MDDTATHATAARPNADRLPDLARDELLRYSRHLLLPEVGVEGQRRLKGARVLAVGAGGLGSPLALYLAAAGVGTIGVVDGDAVDLTNLQRQVLHSTADVGRAKVESAAERLQALNPHVRVEPIPERLTASNALEILDDFHIVVDGSDNFPTRYLVSDACVLLGRPNVYGSIFRFQGQASVFDAARGPCYRCLFAEPPPPELVPSCAEAGVLGVLPGIIGSIQALEAVKWILGAGTSLVGRLLLVDALRLEFRELAVRKDPDCPACGTDPTIRELIDYEAFCGIGSGVHAPEDEVQPQTLAAELEEGRPVILLDVREPHEWAIVHLPAAQRIPLGELPARLAELDARGDIVALCHRGARSMSALTLLRGAGFPRVRSLAGGIDAWTAEVDPTLPRY